MKRIMGLIATAVFVVGVAGSAHAIVATDTFSLTATMQAVSSISMSVNSVDSATSKIWTPVTVTGGAAALSFDPMSYKTFYDTVDPTKVVGNAWLPDHFFAIDIGSQGSVTNYTVAVKYAETNADNPNFAAGGHGLGWKSTVTFMQETGTAENAIVRHGGAGKMLLKDIALTGATGQVVTKADVGSGWLRLYVGIVAKATTGIADPAAGEVFTNADAAGAYKGTLTIVATMT